MRIRVSSPDGTAANGRIELEDGTELQHVTEVAIRGDAAGGVFCAIVTFALPIVDVKGMEATVSEDHLRELAAAHGFDLVRNG